MTDTNELLRRARRAQRDANRDSETPPGGAQDRELPETPSVSRRQRYQEPAEVSPEDADDALVSAGTLQLLANLVDLTKDAAAWTWDLSRRTAAYLATQAAQLRARVEQRRAGRQAEQVRRAEEDRQQLKSWSALRPTEPVSVADTPALQEDPVALAPVSLESALPAAADQGVQQAALPVADDESAEPAPVAPITSPASIARQPREEAFHRIRAAFVVACLLAVAMAGAWWWKHGTPATEIDAPAVAAPESEPTAAPMVVAPPARELPVATPPAAVSDAPVPVVETVIAPAPAAAPAEAPTVIEVRPPAPRAPAARTTPKPTAPAPKEDWQDEAQQEMDAWAEQMGLEPVERLP